MGIVNKRNAVLGWLTWTLGKRVAKRKAQCAMRLQACSLATFMLITTPGSTSFSTPE